MRVRYPDDGGHEFWDKVFGPDIRIELALAKDVFSPTESVDSIFRMETDQSGEVRTVLARLVGHESSHAHGHRDDHHYQGEAIEIFPRLQTFREPMSNGFRFPPMLSEKYP